MRAFGLGTFAIITLASVARAADAQRLAPAFPSVDATPLPVEAGFAGPSARLRYSASGCRPHPVLLVAVNGLAGAAAGWLAYETTFGIWISGEGATPDATMRRVRTTLIATGAIMGVARAFYVLHRCRSP